MTKAERRQLMPWSSSIVDEIRQTFGEVSYIAARENGNAVVWGQKVEGTPAVPVMAKREA